MIQSDARSLADALAAVTPAAGSSVVLPGAAQIAMHGDVALAVRSYGTDTQPTTYVAAAPMEGPDPFDSVLVPAKRLGVICKALGETEVTLSANETHLAVATEHSSASVALIADTAPAPAVDQVSKWIPAEGWAGLTDLLYAASQDPQRPRNQTLMVDDGWVYCTDTYRVAARRSGLPKSFTATMLIPPSLIRQAETVCGPVTHLAKCGKGIAVKGERGDVFSTLVDMEPPPWQAVAPLSEVVPRGSVPTRGFSEALAVGRAVLDSRGHGQDRVHLSSDGSGTVQVRAQGDAAEVLAEVTCDLTLDGRVTVNPSFLAGAIDQFSGETISWGGYCRPGGAMEFIVLSDSEKAHESDDVAVIVPIRDNSA